MAIIRVLSKPDYELTLSSEEMVALAWLLGRQTTDMQKACGLNKEQADSNDSIYYLLPDVVKHRD
jgi:hypothetical protein